MERYEVHTYTLCQGWINCWTTCDEQGHAAPQRFSTIRDALSEIDDFFTDISLEIESRERTEEEGYDREHFRIYDTLKEAYVA